MKTYTYKSCKSKYRRTAVRLSTVSLTFILICMSLAGLAQTNLSRLERAPQKYMVPAAMVPVVSNGDTTWHQAYVRLDSLITFPELTEVDGVIGNEYGNAVISNDSLFYRQCPTCPYLLVGTFPELIEIDGDTTNEYGNVLVSNDSLYYRQCPTCTYEYKNIVVSRRDSIYSIFPFGPTGIIHLRDGEGSVEYDPSPFNEIQDIEGYETTVGSSLLSPHNQKRINIYTSPKSGFFIPPDYSFEIDQSNYNEIGNSYVRIDSLFYQRCQECEEIFVSVYDTSNSNEMGNIYISNDSIFYQACSECSIDFKFAFPDIPDPDGSETIVESGDNISVAGSGTIEDPYLINNTAPENTDVNGSSTVNLWMVGNVINAEVEPGSIAPLFLDRTYIESEVDGDTLNEIQYLIGGDAQISISKSNTLSVLIDNCEDVEDELYLNLVLNVDQSTGFVDESYAAIGDTITDHALKIKGSYILLPSGTTSQRPIDENEGILRFNSSTGYFEIYSGSNWETLKSVISSNQSSGSYTEANPVNIGSGSGNYTLNIFGSAMRIPVGRSFQRPSFVTPGLVRYNLGFHTIEYFNGNSWKRVLTEFKDNYHGSESFTSGVCIGCSMSPPQYIFEVRAYGAIHFNTERPSIAIAGLFGYNESSGKIEGYNGTHWVEF